MEESEDALEPAAEPTDDTPTIISRSAPVQPVSDSPPALAEEKSDGLRGRHLAHFELIEQIGVGGMAAVLRARDTQLDRAVALKILPPDLAADAENIRRFHQEARSAAKLDHENIARVFFCGEDQNLHFIAFEFVEGDNLRVILEQKGQLPVTEALSYLIQIALGLCHAAERGVVHRDIKPSNIIITPSGRAKLVDMGLARSLEPQTDNGLTQSGVTLGTFDYISPEQALEPREADVRSDIYSLGCTFYHMLTGRPPVPEGTAAKKLHHHQHVKPVDPRVLVPGLPDEVAIILDRMMAKSPRHRYQTPEELVGDLVTATRGLQGEKTEGILLVETPSAVGHSAGRSHALAIALAIGAVVALSLGLYQPAPEQAAGPGLAPGPGPSQPAPAGPRSQVPPAPPHSTQGSPSTPEQPVASSLPVRFDSDETAMPLGEWLERNRYAQKLEILLGRDIDLWIREDTPDPGLVFRARQEVVLRAKDPSRRPTIRLTYDGLPRRSTPWAALTIESPNSQVEGVRVIIDARGSGAEMVGLLIRGGQTHRVHRCDFFQAQPGLEGRLASVVVQTPPTTESQVPPSVNLSQCCWLGYRDLVAAAIPTSGVEAGTSPAPAGSERGRDAALLQLTGITPGGQLAVACRGPASVLVQQSAFGPHAQAFSLSETPGKTSSPLSLPIADNTSTVQVEHCSFLLQGSTTVFHVGERVEAGLQARYSLFSCPDHSLARPGQTSGEAGASARPVLITQAAGGGKASFLGEDNRYHRLDGLWAVQEEDGREIQIGVKEAGRLLGERGLGRDTSRALTGHPWWEAEPLGRLDSYSLTLQPHGATIPREEPGVRALEEQQIVQTFQVDDRLRDLRQTGSWKDHLIGLEQLGTHSYLTSLSTLDDRTTESRQEKVVDPTSPDPTNDIYATLEQAVLAARGGDVILVRHNGLLPVRPLQLEDPSVELTIRPARGYHPVLTIGDTVHTDAALFTVHDGQLVLDGLAIHLGPKEDRFGSQSVVAMIGEGRCSLTGCLITLDPGDFEVRLSVASHPQPSGVRRMGKSRETTQTPRLTLENCFVRGKGDLIVSRGSRSLDVEAGSSLVALTGSFLVAHASGARGAAAAAAETALPLLLPPGKTPAPEEPPLELPGQEGSAAPEATITLRLSRVTAYLGSHLICWQGRVEVRKLPAVQLNPAACLFLPSREAGVLIHWEGKGNDPGASVRSKLRWESGSNAYGSWTGLLDPQGSMEEMPVSLDQWKTLTGEYMSKFRVKLAVDLPGDVPLTQLTPSHFKVSEAPGMGADPVPLSRALPSFE